MTFEDQPAFRETVTDFLNANVKDQENLRKQTGAADLGIEPAKPAKALLVLHRAIRRCCRSIPNCRFHVGEVQVDPVD